MPITVVINRDYGGATTCREVYAAGARYQIASSNLEIFSAKSQLLALYGSGNWLSVHIDDLQAPTQTAAAAAAAAINAAAAAGAVEDVDLSADFVAPDESRSAAVESRPADVEPRPADDDDPGSGYEHPESDPGSIRWGASERMAARSPSMMPVVFRPRTYRAARDGATEKPEPTGTQWGEASRFRPVVFRPKTYRAARAEPAEPTPPPDDDDTAED